MIDIQRRCAAVIPCLNESRNIRAVVEGARRHLPEVLVVDDGSRDGTAKIAAAAGATVVRNSGHCGKGAALRVGWREAKRRGFDWVLSLDGDGQHDPADIPQFFNRAAATSARLIVGNRMAQWRETPWVRRVANTWMSRCLSKLTGATLPDSQCGFRLLHLDTVLSLPLEANGFVIESETLVQFLAAGHAVEFVPIRVIYGVEQSKIRPVRDTWRWMRWWAAQSPVSVSL